MYAGIQPPFDILINYAIGLIVLLLVLWFGIERRRFKGPPIGADIAQARRRRSPLPRRRSARRA